MSDRTSDRRWAPGETVLLQEVWRGRLWSARPMIVALDRGGSTALWFPKGTRWKGPTTPPARVRAETRTQRLMESLTLCDWVLADREWDVSSLWLMEAGAHHAVWVSWREGGEHYGWYINLQEPFRRTARGFQWMDLMLDVIVEPDRRWHWKDEDDFQGMIGHNLIDDAKARAVRAEAESVIRRLEANASPFCDPWPDWRPDPAWRSPLLPPAWDRIDEVLT
ncbi:MAG: DUF402 domain-containing protein [Dehalococcoidia bacterium]